MNTELSDIIEELKEKIASIDSKIIFQRTPIKPKKPSPLKTKDIKLEKPKFFNFKMLLLNTVLWAFPIVYIPKLFFEIHPSDTIIIALILALLTRLFIHNSEIELYNKKTDAYNLRLTEYEEKLATYERQSAKYYVEVEDYNVINQKNQILKRTKAELEAELDSIYNILGIKKSKLSDNSRIVINLKQKMTTSKSSEPEINERIKKSIDYISKLSENRRKKIINLLKRVHDVQKSNLDNSEKTTEIKKILWTSQSSFSKLFIGGLLGTIGGLLIFGTGGIGIAGLGGAVGVWGFLTGTAGGVLISSLIQNFENRSEK